MTEPDAQISLHHKSQPPSYRNPEYRRSQLLRQYTSVIRTAPLMVFFQHNNLKSVEWVAIRRELTTAMRKADEEIAAQGRVVPELAPHIRMNIIQTRIFDVAMRIVEYFRPEKNLPAVGEPALTHDLSKEAHDAVKHMKGKHDMAPILVGPLAILTFPTVSPEHLKAALSILCPKTLGVKAPKRKVNPGWYELPVQNGLEKLNLVAARMDRDVMDVDQAKWLTSIEGGMDGLRSQLVRALQSVGASVTNTLEGASKSLYLTLESRRSVLEEEQKGPEEKGEQKEEKKDGE